MRLFCAIFLFLCLLGFPQSTHAGVFSFVGKIFASESNASEAPVTAQNSQTMPLLQAVVNSNPNPTKGEADLSIVADSALETSSGPAGAGAEAQNSKISSEKISVYTVRAGDSLTQIAQMFGVSVNTILWANNLKSPKDIHPDENLVILPISGVKYIVKKGDTLKSIAAAYKGDVADIQSFNNIADGVGLTVGQEVIIPDGDATPPQTTSGGKTTQVAVGVSASSAKGYFIRPSTGIKTQGLHGQYRTAVDLASPVGTTVRAAAAGKVIVARVGGYNGGYGNYIVIQHNNGMQSLYAHLSEVDVAAGATVSQGDLIAKSGNTGNSTGPHLHFEILGSGVRNWNPFN